MNAPIVFAMDGATDIAKSIESWISREWIPGFKLASKDEWRRHDRESHVLAHDSVRGRHVFIVQSYGTDDMRGVFSERPSFLTPTRVKLKEASGPFADLSPGDRGSMYRPAGADDDSVCVEFHPGANRFIHLDKVSKYLHLLGETVDEKIWGTILFVHSLIDASVDKITLIATMAPYMRQDEKFEPRMVLGPAAFAVQMKAAGVDRIITVDVHCKGAMQNACSAAKIRFDHLEAKVLLAKQSIKGIPKGSRVLALSADIGSSKRSTPQFQATVSKLLSIEWGYDVEVGFAIARKIRSGDTLTKITNIIEDPYFTIGPLDENKRRRAEDSQGAYVLVQDDILATGGTIGDVEEAVVERGGIFHAACYTNGLFTGNAEDNLSSVDSLIGTNTLDPWRIEGTSIRDRLRIVDLGDIFGDAIKQTYIGGSINGLLTGLEPKV